MFHYTGGGFPWFLTSIPKISEEELFSGPGGSVPDKFVCVVVKINEVLAGNDSLGVPLWALLKLARLMNLDRPSSTDVPMMDG